MSPRGSAKVLALAGFSEGRATTGTVAALMRVFGLPQLDLRLPPTEAAGGGSGDWPEVLPLLRRDGVLELTAEPSLVDAHWLAHRDVAVLDRLLVQGRDQTSGLRAPIRCQLAACGPLPLAELLIGLRRPGPALGHVTHDQLAAWLTCQPDLQLRNGSAWLTRSWTLPNAEQAVLACFTPHRVVLPRQELLQLLHRAGMTLGSAKHLIAISVVLRTVGRGGTESRVRLDRQRHRRSVCGGSRLIHFDVGGVTPFQIRDGHIVAGRLYMEDLDRAAADIGQPIHALLGQQARLAKLRPERRATRRSRCQIASASGQGAALGPGRCCPA